MADKTYDEIHSADRDKHQMSEGGEVSEGPSGSGDLETALGGADSVPDTPDALPYTPEQTNPRAGK